ncbi:hypothetical protein Vadar_011620 [Vaccinium darrowii]|uniref:Uncharacterized protein n=1 Tax=Vaccinium darrowii TaxID=229202 RepID=A0ACB7ZB43_9ERIC|nr:hypothetical protein Vadar_011620 [Vaccinium darrowii]
METLGVKVTSVKEWEQLPNALRRVKHKMNLSFSSRVIRIDKPGAHCNIHSKGLDKDKMPSSDLIISKPFHGKQNPEYQGSEKFDGRGKESLVVQKGVEVEEQGCNESKPLGGKRILVAEDNVVLRKGAVANVSGLGAMVESCENGKQALELVCKGLSDQTRKLDGAAASNTYWL